MRVSRPFTPNSLAYQSQPKSKLLISRIKRPSSARNTSLKKIIQVIEKTLQKDAQTILKKVQTLDRYSKLKSRTKTPSIEVTK
jgi:hypothetical protein